jgi:uncharacterized protein (UPF0332 family)
LIEPADLTRIAEAFLFIDGYPEAAVRRAVSTAYYGLFHAIAAGGSALFKVGVDARRHIVRAYDHRSIGAACRHLEERAAKKVRDASPAPDSRLVLVARTFRELREARETADYDLETNLSWDHAAELVAASATACTLIAEIADLPETQALLVAALLPERARRG